MFLLPKGKRFRLPEQLPSGPFYVRVGNQIVKIKRGGALPVRPAIVSRKQHDGPGNPFLLFQNIQPSLFLLALIVRERVNVQIVLVPLTDVFFLHPCHPPEKQGKYARNLLGFCRFKTISHLQRLLRSPNGKRATVSHEKPRETTTAFFCIIP